MLGRETIDQNAAVLIADSDMKTLGNILKLNTKPLALCRKPCGNRNGIRRVRDAVHESLAIRTAITDTAARIGGFKVDNVASTIELYFAARL